MYNAVENALWPTEELLLGARIKPKEINAVAILISYLHVCHVINYKRKKKTIRIKIIFSILEHFLKIVAL